MPASPSVARELVAHSQALRRLATDLVGGGDADDLVQDTALRALRSPPPVPNGLFSWLATVMKHLAANRRRGAMRRQQRERANGPPGEVPPAADEVAQRDHVRAVTEAVWALPEPYQGTLVQRYFQDRTPARIAERTAVPLATVKSRLQRGLEMLRAALARRDGRDWRASLGPAFGLAAHSPWLLPTLSVASMTTLGKSAAAVAACGVVAIAWWVCAPAAPPMAPIADANASEPRASAAITGADERPANEARIAGSTAADALLALAQPFAFELRARVVDADGLPIGGAHVALAPPGCALALSPQQTDEEGRVAVTWRGRVPAMTMSVGLAIQGSHTSLQEVKVAAGAVAELHFVGGTAPLPAQVQVDALGRQIVTMPDCAQGHADCRKCHEGVPGVNLFEVRDGMRAGLHPDATFGDRLAIAPPDPNAADFEGLGHFGIAPSAQGGSRGWVVEGRVFGVDGSPAVGVRIQLFRGSVSQRTLTDAQGSYRMPKLLHGPAIVRAGGGPEGLATRDVEIIGARTTVPDLILETGRTLRGRALAADGAALNGARVEFVSAAGGDGDLATVGPDGAFAFANLPPGPGRLLLWGVRGEKVPIAEERDVPLDGGEVVFDLRRRPPSRGELRVFVRGHDGEVPASLEVRAWQQDTGRGAFLDRREDGAFHLHGVMAGFYRVEVGALASGFVDLGQQWVDGEGLADLGTVQLPRPGRLRIDAAKRPANLELYARRADIDVRVDEIAPWTRDALLPPGRWLVMWKHDGVITARELTLAAGLDAVLRLDP